MNKIKCLVSIVNHNKEHILMNIYNRHSLRFIYATLALGTASSDILDYLGIGETEKTLAFGFIPEQMESSLVQEIANEINIRKKGHGIIFTVPLSGMSAAFQKNLMNNMICKEEPMKPKQREYELVVALVEHGWKDQVMDAAKEANATGGTVLHARSFHEDSQTSFFGIPLQGEKDVVVILAPLTDSKNIMEKINYSCGLKSEARGLIFSMPVDEFMGI